MKAKARKSCPNCSRLQAKLNAQQAELEAQKRRLAALEATVARLEEQLAAARKNSATSSKPPSSDIVKPPKPPPPEGQAQRKIGGQPGHPKHERDPFPPEAINDGSLDYRIELCPRCGQGLEPAAWSEPRIIQQVDINEVPLSIQEHRGHSGWCSCCQRLYTAPLPIGIERRAGWTCIAMPAIPDGRVRHRSVTPFLQNGSGSDQCLGTVDRPTARRMLQLGSHRAPTPVAVAAAALLKAWEWAGPELRCVACHVWYVWYVVHVLACPVCVVCGACSCMCLAGALRQQVGRD